MRILIVEDDVRQRELLQKMFERKGYEALTAPDGQTALDILQREPVRLVITDWAMPNMDGLSLIRHIRSARLTSYTYLIVLTGLNSPDHVVGGLEAGADDYITKPFTLRELQLRVAIGERIIRLETQLREARDQLAMLATRDNLTGLLNRHGLQERVGALLSQAARERKPLGVILLDIDHFKRINDQFGHAAGDEVLRWVGATLLQSVRPYDCVARWGGEEFLVLLPGAPLTIAATVAERLRRNISAADFVLSMGQALPVRISLGVTSTLSVQQFDLSALAQQADTALYQAKQQGRNRVCVYGEDRLSADSKQ
jgi:diguanylate cyclase (GGDEF)-like protein